MHTILKTYCLVLLRLFFLNDLVIFPHTVIFLAPAKITYFVNCQLIAICTVNIYLFIFHYDKPLNQRIICREDQDVTMKLVT